MFRPHRRPAVESDFLLAGAVPHHEAVALCVPTLGGMDEYRLVDRSTGRAKPFALPDERELGICARLCRGATRNGQRGSRRAMDPVQRRVEGKLSAAWGCSALADPTVVHSIDLDVLPTGRPCWVPGRPGRILLLFPKGDGQLHRCHLTPGPKRSEQGRRIRVG